MAKSIYFAFLIGLCWCNFSQQSPPLFSLQPAVEALSEREAQLALRNEIENGNIDNFDDNDFDWNNDYENLEHESRIQVPNKALARYLARSSDYEEMYPTQYRKRSMNRKRDSSVFRERSRVPNVSRQQQEALAEKFLKAIEGEREKEEDEEYQKQLRNLWSRYQVAEGDIEKELFDNELEADYPFIGEENRKRNRQHFGEVEVAPYNDKRSMPALPWLPASRKKRFPVSKRSPKEIRPETSEKVSQDLVGIFGQTESMDTENKVKQKRSSNSALPQLADTKQATESTKDLKTKPEVHNHVMEKKRKRDISDPDEDEEAENDNAEEDASEDSDDSSEDDSKKKKKREVTKENEVVRSDSKSVKQRSAEKPFQWSNIFGIDRKKKSVDLIYHPLKADVSRKKRCDASGCDEDYNEEDYVDEDFRKKGRSREEKLDAMDRKLKTIENVIIEDAAKYYDSHASMRPSESRNLKNHVADRLATAYSLEKMRKAIARLKQSMAFEKNLEKNLLGAPLDDGDYYDKKKKAKRVAVKKEKAEFDNNDHDVDSPVKKASKEPKQNELGEVDDNKKKKKRSQKKSELGNLISDEALMSEGYMGGRASNECPLLDAIEKKCRGIDIMSGDSRQELLEACGSHQLCYLCGDSPLQCDYVYLNDADEVCRHDLKCKIAAREVLSVLRNLGGSRISPRECIRNPCLNMALRSIESF